MLFNSFVFILFAILFFSVWPLVRRQNGLRWAFLTLASFVFYGWWDWRFLFLIVGSGLIDYLSVLGMARWPSRRKLLLGLSILGNVGSLAVFKYSHFVAQNMDELLGILGLEPVFSPNIPSFMLILPVGISFYTFQSMSYTIDAYRGKLRPTRNILHFFSYLSMFPQLVAGPIIRATDLLPQLETYRPTTERQRWEGMRLMVHGFFKKVVIADNLAPTVTAAFAGQYNSDGTVFWWITITMFATQIYCDFSGYSDIARGLGRWMGFEFPLNFNHPYTAVSFRDFWSRWHISLSTWFRDYVYIPLGGSRKGPTRSFLNLWATMLVSGLWHGAGWAFVAWGVMHAMLMTIERLIGFPKRILKIPGGSYIATAIVLLGVWVSWAMFRCESLGQGLHIIYRMFIYHPGSIYMLRWPTVFVGILALRELFIKVFPDFEAWRDHRARRIMDVVLASTMVAACVFLRGPGSAFIYFQF